MASEFMKRRRARRPRQDWNPHWIIKLLYTAFSLAVSLLKIAVGAAATVLMILVICGIVFVGTLGDYLQDEILTEAQDWSIDDYDVEETSFMYYVDSRGKVQQLQQIFTTTDRQWVELEDIPEDLIHATVAIEDKRFYEHQGVDWITTVKACLNMFFGGDSQFGGSTITQQLVKNVTNAKSVTVQRKVMEIFRAQVFEREYDKDVILEQYLNRIYLGRGCYGVKSAAAEYFGKELQSLTTAECASLISITNNPSLFNPFSDNEFKFEGVVTDGAGRNRSRQLKVLYQMLDQGYITREEYNEARDQEMVFKHGIAEGDRWAACENAECGYEGTVSTFTKEGDTYYCPKCGNPTPVSTDASQHVYSWFVDAVLNDVAAEFAAKDHVDWDTAEKNIRDYYLGRIQKGGYHIYTTLDMAVQNVVDSVYENLENIPTTRSSQQLDSAIVVIDNRTGDIVALSGGVGEKKDFLAYNRATQAKLQTGSAQKPISVYAPGFQKGTITPATVVKDMPIFYEDGPYPKNDNRKYNYARTVFNGIVYSVNTISSRTLNMIGYDYAYDFAKHNFGQKSLTEDYPLPSGKSLSDLGIAPLAMGALTVGSTVREMASAYATFPNQGVYREGRLFTKVYNSDGKLILDNTQEEKKILDDKAVNYMNYCLYNAANSGTGGAALFPGQHIAGKTGTTSSNRDRWFCGYTSHYTAAVWCGYNLPEEIRLTGNMGNPAARLWRKVMQPIHSGLSNEGLYNGSVFKTVGVCLDSGLLATAACQNDIRGIGRVQYANVYPGDEPQGTCNKHVPMNYCITGGGVATDWCYKFAEYEAVDIQNLSLVKMTPEEVEEIRKAMNVGLVDSYYNDSYVYLVDENGNPLPWHGFHNDRNLDLSVPYLPCPLHTQASWLEFENGYQPDNGYPDGGYEDGYEGGYDDGYNDGYDNTPQWNEDQGVWE